MCGLIGIFRERPASFEAGLLAKPLRALHHRGPDETTTWLDPSGYAAFGYARLALVGLSNGTQPIVASEEDIVLMVNGEFYDFERIRADLTSRGCNFKTSSDSEIALHFYRLHGLAGLRQLRGEFAILLLDRRRNLLLALRDRLGVKPLYYANHAGTWYFASEIKAILAAGVPAVWDEEAYASRAFILRDRTMFRGVHSVQPGCWMIVDRGGARSGRYWDLDFVTQTAASASIVDERDAVIEVRSAIEEAVRLRLRADVGIGVCLSGGIDSSSVLGIASRMSGKRLDAFHLSFGGMEGYDEIGFAKLAAEHNGASLHPVSITQDDLADRVDETVWHAEMPFFNAHSIAKLILCKHIGASGTRAVITGEGADEVFGGYPHFRRDMALYNSEHQDPRVVQDLLARVRASRVAPSRARTPQDLAWIAKQLSHGVSWLEAQAALIAPIETLYADGFNERFGLVEGYRQFYDRLDHSRLDDRAPVHRSMYLLAKSCLPNIVLSTLGDRVEMAGSIEGRPPFLDHKVVELACRLPVWMKLRGMTEKYVLREAMRPYLPEPLYRRKKQYFRAPPIAVDKDSKLYQLVHDELTGASLKKIPFFDPGKVRALSDGLARLPQSEQANLDYVLMEIAGLCLMQRRFSLAATS
jgi:asparagine synthase (glutamine-hydrolysing)